MKTNRQFAAFIAAIGCSILSASAATFYWDAGAVIVNGASEGGTGAWTVGAAGWEDGTIAQDWADGNAAVFGGTVGTVTLGGAISASDATFNTAGYVIDTAGNHLTLTGGASGSASTIILSGGSKLSSGDGITINSAITLGTGGGNLSGGTGNYGIFTGKVSGGTAGTTSLTIDSGYTQFENTANDFLGNISVSDYYLKTVVSEVIPDTAEITIGTNGGLKFQPSAAGSYTETIAALNGGGYQTWAEGADVNFNLRVGNGGANSNYSSSITEFGGAVLSLTKIGGGTMTLDGPNSYTGTTIVNGGTLVLKTLDFNTYSGGQIQINNGSALEIEAGGGNNRYDFGTQTYQFDASGGGTITAGSTLNWVAQGDWTFKTNGGAKNIINGGGSMNLNGRSVVLDVAPGTDAASDLDVGVGMGNTTGGLTKFGAGTATLSGANGYTGDTTVNDGTLAVTGSSIDDSNTLIIDGGKVHLTGAETVKTLFFGDVQQAPGTYSSNGNQLTGGGTLIVTDGPVSGFASWMAPFISGGLTGDTTPGGDPENDGMKNLLEYALNGNPSISDPSIQPDLVVTATDFEFTYSRLDLSLADTTQTFEYGSDLSGWTPVLIPEDHTGVHTVGDATVTITDTDATTDSVKISIPKSVIPGGKLFGRLQVVK